MANVQGTKTLRQNVASAGRARVVGGVVPLLLVAAGRLDAQTATTPTKTLCKTWDTAFLGTYNVTLIALLLIPLAAWFVVTLVPFRGWWRTRPLLRALWPTLGLLLLVVGGTVAWPWVFGFDAPWFAGTGSNYMECRQIPFNAQGLFGGRIGAGVAAISQWPLMVCFQLLAVAIGFFLVWVVCRFSAAIVGARARARRGTL